MYVQFSHSIKSVITSIILHTCNTIALLHVLNACEELFYVCTENFVDNYMQRYFYMIYDFPSN